MSPRARGFILALLQILIVGSLGVKLLLDRRMLPKVWVQTAPYDPNLPIRGRYVQLLLVVRAERLFAGGSEEQRRAGRFFEHSGRLQIEDGQLVVGPTPEGEGVPVMLGPDADPARARLAEPVAYFLPEHVADPSRRKEGEELWVEVTVPRAGPPRPIRLGIRKNGTLTPLEPR